MDRARIIVLGGCHVAGYPIDPAHSFPNLVSQLVDGDIVGRVAHLQFVHLPNHLTKFAALRPSHVVLQLGNYEFSASLCCLLQQIGGVSGNWLGIGSYVKKARAKNKQEPANLPIDAQAVAVPPTTRLACYARVAGLGLLTALLWLFSGPHRRSFRALNAYIRQHPDTVFIFLSPFPCLDPAANRLREFGGWLIRHRLKARPNYHWLDSHRLLRPDPRLFADQSHLNKFAHRVLAHGVAAVAFGNPNPETASKQAIAVHALAG